MRIEVNGEMVDLPDSTSVAHAVASAGVDSGRRGLAVAVDGDVVPRSSWDRVRLREGQRVEVVEAIQGGGR